MVLPAKSIAAAPTACTAQRPKPCIEHPSQYSPQHSAPARRRTCPYTSLSDARRGRIERSMSARPHQVPWVSTAPQGEGKVCTGLYFAGGDLVVGGGGGFATLGTPKPPDGLTRAHLKCKPMPCSEAERFPNQRGRFRTARAQRQLLRCSSREHPCKPPPNRSGHDPFKPASGVQSSGPGDPWLPGVENSRLYAQRGHSARCAP